jgi:SAM-dependent methyltransferase
MKLNSRFLIVFSVLFLMLVISAFKISDDPSFNSKKYGSIANYFGSADEMLRFFDFQKGDVVAEIGARSGRNIIGLTTFTDSITWYLEDIDASQLNEKALTKVKKQSSKNRNGTETHRFFMTIGTETQTMLPENTFDKILIINSFHEFTRKNEMISDIKNKLKKTGRIYILESQCIETGHKNITSGETISMMNDHGFRMISIDTTNRNNSVGAYRVAFEIK